ncbi:FxsA family protein [Geodermatophilus marinus]|nr:FxsA family protein [Geodermatophilus sp. LHW52908]
MGSRIRLAVALAAAVEVAVVVLVAGWIGIGWTLLAMLATSALGWVLLARQGTRALADLRERARSGRAPGRALGDAGLIAVGGLLMVLPGFVGDLLGLLCLLPPTRFLVRGLVARVLADRIPVALRGPVRVRSARVEEVEVQEVWRPGPQPRAARPRVIEGEVAEGQAVDGQVVEGQAVPGAHRDGPAGRP